MSEFEDRQDAAPAIEAPAADTPAPATPVSADLEAVAAVEGTAAAAAPVLARELPALADPVPRFAALESGGEDAPLLDDAIEAGIASVFASLQAAAESGEAHGPGEPGEYGEPAVSVEPPRPLGDAEAAEGVTFRLLGELDRLWHRAA